MTHNREGDEDALAYSPALSPDGARLAFAETRCHYCPTTIQVARIGAGRWLGRAVATGFDPAWAPDGRRLAFVTPAGAIAVTTPGGSKPHVVVRGGLANDEPSWQPGGERLAFARQLTAATWRVFTVDVDGSALQAVTHGPRSALDPAWSPDGRRLAFAYQAASGRWQICVATAVGQLRRCYRSAFSDTQPAWSPDGRWLAFVRQSGLRSSVWIMRPDGAAAHRVAPPRGFLAALQPSWTPRAGELLFVGRRE